MTSFRNLTKRLEKLGCLFKQSLTFFEFKIITLLNFYVSYAGFNSLKTFTNLKNTGIDKKNLDPNVACIIKKQ